MVLYRDEVYDENSTDKGTAEINYVKNRHGPTGVVRVRWQAPFMRFCNLKEEY
jgi:replicative DNA helicase